MKWFGLVSYSGLRDITSEQVAQWHLGNLFIPFRIPKMIIVNAGGHFSRIPKKNFQETVRILAHALVILNHKEIINEGFIVT